MLSHRKPRSVVAYTSQMFDEATLEASFFHFHKVSISGRICNRRDSRMVKADLTLFDISFTESLTSTYGFGR